MKLTRRDFIKTAGAATGTMAISSVIPMPAWAEGQNGGAILTAARWGAVYVEVKDGKVVSSKGALPKTVPNSLQQNRAGSGPYQYPRKISDGAQKLSGKPG